MKKAICLPYCVDQNEPSVPLNRIIELPDDEESRDILLKKLFTEHVCDVDEDEVEVNERQHEDDYGDIIVSTDDGGLFMYVTFIEE